MFTVKTPHIVTTSECQNIPTWTTSDADTAMTANDTLLPMTRTRVLCFPPSVQSRPPRDTRYVYQQEVDLTSEFPAADRCSGLRSQGKPRGCSVAPPWHREQTAPCLWCWLAINVCDDGEVVVSLCVIGSPVWDNWVLMIGVAQRCVVLLTGVPLCATALNVALLHLNHCFFVCVCVCVNNLTVSGVVVSQIRFIFLLIMFNY